jgi:transcriptional regulator with XRE-family HTH domain
MVRNMSETTTTEIERLRRDLGWTQSRMAEYLAVDQSMISRLENGDEPSGPVQKLLRILSANKDLHIAPDRQVTAVPTVVGRGIGESSAAEAPPDAFDDDAPFIVPMVD